MSSEKDFHPSKVELDEAFNDGYRAGYNMDGNLNPYEPDSELWEEYNDGYRIGYSES